MYFKEINQRYQNIMLKAVKTKIKICMKPVWNGEFEVIIKNDLYKAKDFSKFSGILLFVLN